MNIKKLLAKKWYFQGFNGTLTLLVGASGSAVKEMKDKLGYGYEAIIMYFIKDKCYFLYAWDDLYKLLDEIKSRAKDKDYLRYLDKEDEKACEESLKFYHDLEKMDLSKNNLKELQELFIKTNKAYANILKVSHLIEGWTLTIEEKIREKAKEHLSVLIAPVFIPFFTKEEIELQGIVKEAKEKGFSKEIDKRIKEHQKKYFWKNNSYASSKVLELSDFKKEIKELVKKPLKKFDDVKENKIKKERLLKKLNDPELSELIKINDVIFRIHDRRKEHMTISLHYIDMILKEINKRTKISIENLRYLLPIEVNKVKRLDLEKRRKKCIYFRTYDEEELFTGEKAEEYISMLEKQFKVKEGEIIKGNCASKGFAKGRVKVCRGEKEISKVEKGDILVACMTQPEFVPAMKKASAIVTDEGGLTCHAAIVSRELGIPCVVGTRVATKVLKDGDRVEVDAEKGVVRVVK